MASFSPDSNHVDLSNQDGYDDSTDPEADSPPAGVSQAIIENMEETVLITDRKGQFTFVSPNVKSLFGLSPGRIQQSHTVDDLLGLRLTDIENPSSLEDLEDIQRAITTPEGEFRYLSVCVREIESDTGNYLIECSDITDLVKERENRESTERNFQTMADYFPGNFWVADLYGSEVHYVSPEFESLFHQSAEDLHDDPLAFMEQVHPDDHSIIYEALKAIQNNPGASPSEMEYRIQTPEGLGWVRTRCVAIRNQEGEFDRLVGYSVDITEKKKLEQQLGEKTEYLSTIFNTTPNVVAVKDSTMRYELVNETFIDFFDKTREEVLGKRLSDFLPDEQAVETEQVQRDALKQGESIEDHDVMYTDPKTGQKRWFTERSVPINPDAPYDERKLLVVVTDITERKESELALKEQEERFRQLAENIDEVFWLLSDEGKLLYVSPAFEDIYGISVNKLYDNPQAIYELIHPDDRVRVREAMESQLVSESPEDYEEEYRIVRPDGDVRWVRDRAFPVQNEQGDVNRIAGIAVDITEQKTLQKQLETALEEKTTLLQEVHHRVKNNLQVVLGLLGLQARRVDVPEANQALNNSKQRIQSMAMIHKKLYEGNLTNLNFEEYVQELVEGILQSQDFSRLSPEVEINIQSANLGPETAIYCGLLINELVSNSLKHAFDNQKDKKVFIEFFSDDDLDRHLIVADNGTGPSPKALRESDTLGIRLIRALAENQLDGELRMSESDGLRTEIIFPPPEVGYEEENPD